MRFLLAATLLLSGLTAPTLAAQPINPVLGIWSNPRGTIAVRTLPCSGGLCGEIVWANAEAMADARDAGIERLLGTQLLQDYRPEGRGRWAGRVYVPDMGRTFSSRIKQDSTDRLTISGCLVGGFLCKSQVWHRVS